MKLGTIFVLGLVFFGCSSEPLTRLALERSLDDETWERNTSVVKFEFENRITCTLSEIVKGKSDRPKGDVTVSCSQGTSNLFLKERYAQIILKHNDYFLGISNIRLYDDMFWILDLKGNLLNWKTHLNLVDHSDFYCEFTKNYKAEWYDEKNPNIEFIEKDGKLEDILINSCKGDRISLKKISSNWP